jgi:putative iron-regulated protein
LGILDVFAARYISKSGAVIEGPSLEAYLVSKDAEAAKSVAADLQGTLSALRAIRDMAESGTMAYDQMIAEGNAEGNALVQAGVDGLVRQTRSLEAAAAKAGIAIKVEGSDSLDNPDSVQ